MEMKWTMISVAVIFTAMFVGLGFSEHYKSQCRLAYAQSNKTVDEIVKLCGK